MIRAPCAVSRETQSTKIKMNKKLKTLGIALVMALQAIVVPVLADFLPVRAYGTDTVAGYASALRTSLINPGQNIVFVVEKLSEFVKRSKLASVEFVYCPKDAPKPNFEK